MLYLGFLLFVAGMFALPISILVLIVRACIKKSIKGAKRVAGISVIGLIAGFFLLAFSPDLEDSDIVSNEEENNFVEETSVTVEENSIMDEDNYDEEDIILGSAKADEFYESEPGWSEYTEGYEGNYNEDSFIDEGEQAYSNDNNAFSSNNNTNKVNIEDMQGYVFTISEYPYQNKKQAKTMMKTYEKAMKASINDFVYLEEVSEGGLITSKKVHYKKTINAEDAAYKYYGKLNRKDEPDGTGLLLEIWNEESYENDSECITAVYYIGEFNNGFKDGYGIEYDVDMGKGSFALSYEGDFKKGEYHGDGVSYLGSDVDSDIEYEYRMMLQERLYGASSNAYDVLFPQINGNKLTTFPILLSYIYYDGKFKDGLYNGKGKSYFGYDDQGNPALTYEGEFKNGSYEGKGTEYFRNGEVKYKGEFKNGEYNGKGTLYDEQGNVIHKGKFKKGDVA